MKRYGFFLNVLPGERSTEIEERPFIREALTAAAALPDVELVIVAPSWFEAQVSGWLKRSNLARSSISVLGAPRPPALFYAVDLLRNLSELDTWRNVNQRGRVIVRSIVRSIVRLTSSRRRFFTVVGAVLAILAVALVLLLRVFPDGFFLVVLLAAIAVLAAALYRLRSRLRAVPRSILTWARSARMRLLYRRLVEQHIDGLTATANKNTAVEVWLILEPYTFGTRRLDAPTVAIVPQLLPLEDPLAYSDTSHQKQHLRSLDLLDRCSLIICNDEAVRDRHLIYGAGLPRDKIRVIPEGRSELPLAIGKGPADENTRLLRARQIVRPFQRGALGHRLAHARVDLGRDPFLIYAGDSAPHHHCLVLLRALQRLNHGEQQPFRLVIRRSLVELPLVEEWLEQEAPELAPYIVSLVDETPLIWAAFNTLARCAIDPSLFSSCFPSTFGQAVCAWTPILMSDIPAVASKIDDEALRRDMLFDPYDVHSLATRLAWALRNREELVTRQRMMFDTLPTWSETGTGIMATLAAAGRQERSRQ